VAPHFHQRLDLLFIDGGHSREMAWADFRLWAPRLRPGGFLLIHDVFEDPNDGGRPPFEIYTAAVNSAYFVDESREGSLRALVRVK
jgi:predicted O-methyltransferase YrrM